ncbi:DNA alkylation response protein [Paracoccus aurantiacus]|uniref:DNA alkylation response protein n=1 Tax=Paracoccus aurantiacus TaxID=2599412 RepID=A0A5C6S8F0_9RHOB|nr:acyl-CoA dehydrogenase family protein [Paracoccus aurantiacus]TXB71119.1 DNA alkylation response protein [Paracoccus aurantiacus]
MTSSPEASLGTHQVTNQPEPVGDRDLLGVDPLFETMLSRSGVGLAELRAYGQALGRQSMRDAARDANRNSPDLRLFDSAGRRLDEVRFHPAYHGFMQLSAAAGYHSVAWEGGANGNLRHAAMVYLASQVEPGHCCPLTMTYAAAPVLAQADGLANWHSAILSRDYDPSVRPVSEKRGATLGMAMTEKQGGSDVRSNRTEAVRDGGDWRLRGHKWFCSAPMSDGFLTLAQVDGAGLTCFLVPRWLEDGRNAIRLQRLKDKLGNRSNASAEIEYDGARANLVGTPGNGIRTILGMVHHTRLDTAMAPAGLMRAALSEAVHWTRHRRAFGRQLIDQPLMQAVLADCALDWAGSLALGLQVAQRFDGTSEDDRAFTRIAVALAKYLSNKLCPQVVCEAMEAIGGSGYVEDGVLPMLYREAPLNGIWEGSANVICLDALRSMKGDGHSAEALRWTLEAARGQDTTYDSALRSYQSRWTTPPSEADARWFVEDTAALLTAAVLLAQQIPLVTEAYLQTRLGQQRGRFYGSLPAGQADGILDACFCG